ncbi:MAG TPA: hypothetical protein VHZ81_03660 [Galbitalea sp.]|jgi:hypothetical protein|nr:hypothetical protein [Galbitalea sp.]
MRNTVRNVALIIFVLIVLGCGFAVLYLGTSTGLTFGGSGTRVMSQSGSDPLYGQVGWLRNTSPWPITIKSITTNAVNARSAPGIYLKDEQTTPTEQSSTKPPTWVLSAKKVPYQLDGGALRYLGFVLTPQSQSVAEMTTITVTYSGPLGLTFHSSFGGTRVAVGSSALPDGVLGSDPKASSASLDAYIATIRAALLQPDTKTIAQIMGNGATDDQATAFITSQKAYVAADAVSAFLVTSDGREQRLTFYKGDPTKGALPPIEVIWAHYRWTIQPPG